VDLVFFFDFGHFENPPVPTGAETTLTSIGMGARYWLKERYALRGDVSRGRDGWRLVATLGAPF
jgi:hemolysin activation/secretion protein